MSEWHSSAILINRVDDLSFAIFAILTNAIIEYANAHAVSFRRAYARNCAQPVRRIYEYVSECIGTGGVSPTRIILHIEIVAVGFYYCFFFTEWKLRLICVWWKIGVPCCIMQWKLESFLIKKIIGWTFVWFRFCKSVMA